MTSRRDFLKIAGLTSAALATPVGISLAQSPENPDGYPSGIPGETFLDPTLFSFNEYYKNPPMLGRAHAGVISLRVFTEPSSRASSVGSVGRYYVCPIYEAVRGEPYSLDNPSPIWFRIGEEQYLHSAHILPTHEQFNEPVRQLPPEGFFWAETTVPMAIQHRKPTVTTITYDWDFYKCFYGQVHKVVDIAEDEAGRIWYRIFDDIEEGREAWVLARTMRFISKDEFAPISPDVEDKRIVINLGEQSLSCVENGYPVFRTRIASGTTFADPETGQVIDLRTPRGTSLVQRKRPSRRMKGGENFNDPYDVNGVPWVTYFSFTGAAIHGAYWHNNYGVPRSHGCINVTPDAAKWIYRWSQPYMSYTDEYRWTEEGELATPVEVV